MFGEIALNLAAWRTLRPKIDGKVGHFNYRQTGEEDSEQKILRCEERMKDRETILTRIETNTNKEAKVVVTARKKELQE